MGPSTQPAAAPLKAIIRLCRPGPELQLYRWRATGRGHSRHGADYDYLACIPLARVGTPADVAEAARFLAGPESAWVTGEIFNVDGGQHLRRGPDYAAAFEPMFGAAALRGLPEEGP